MKKPSLVFLIGLSSYWFALTFIVGAVISILIPTLMEDWFGPRHSGRPLGIVMGIGGLVAAVTQLLAGVLSDHSTSRWGCRRPFILAGSSLAIVVFLVMGLAMRSYWHFVVLFILAQVALNIAAAPYTALLPDLVPPEDQGRAAGVLGVSRIFGEGMGIYFSAKMLGKDPMHSSTTSVGGGRVHEKLLPLMVLFSGLILAAALLVTAICKEKPLRDPGGTTWRQAVRKILRTSLRDYPDFTWLLVSRAVMNLGVYTVASFILFFVEHALKAPDYKTATSGLMVYLLVGGAVGSYPAGALSDRFGRKGVLFASCGLTALAGILFALCPTLSFASGCAVVMGLGFGAFLSTDWAFACNLLPAKDPARYLAVWNLAATLPQMVAAPIGGHIADFIHKAGHWEMGMGYRAIFLLAVLYFLVGAALIAKVRETRWAAK